MLDKYFIDDKDYKAPDFQIVGASKCGTSTAWHWLNQLKSVQMSEPKEGRFFELEWSYGTGFYINKYFSSFKNSCILGDANPHNLVIDYVPERMYITNPKTKIILFIRNPIERAFSHWKYLHFFRPGREPLSFHDAIESNRKEFNLNKFVYEGDYVPYRDIIWGGTYKRMYLETGYYMHHIKKYLKFFQKNQIKIIDIDELRNPILFMKDISEFLGIQLNESELYSLDFKSRNLNNNDYTINYQDKIVMSNMKNRYYESVKILSNFTEKDYIKKWNMT